MSEEEIINRLTNPQKYSLIEILRKFKRDGIENYIITKPELIQGLLELYNKEKEKNKELIEGQIKTLEKILLPQLLKKYVSKDKIKEKIRIRKEEKSECKDSIEADKILREIYVLEELLEE